MSGSGPFEFCNHKSLLRFTLPSSSNQDLEAQPSSSRKSGIGDLFRHLDRGLSGRRLSRRHLDSGGSPLSTDDRSLDALADGAPPEWAILLIGCLSGLATRFCVATSNRGICQSRF